MCHAGPSDCGPDCLIGYQGRQSLVMCFVQAFTPKSGVLCKKHFWSWFCATKFSTVSSNVQFSRCSRVVVLASCFQPIEVAPGLEVGFTNGIRNRSTEPCS